MKDLIKSYEQQFGILSADSTAKIGELSRIGREAPDDIDAFNILKLEISETLSEAKDVLEQFELEIRETPKDVRQKFTIRLKSYEEELKRIEREFNVARENVQQIQSRNQLLGAATVDIRESEKEVLINASERVERGTNRLREANRIAIESEQLGVDILSNLSRDRETINRSRARVRETEQNLGASGRVLSGMIRRAIQNKLILYGVIGGLIFFILLTLVIKFKSKYILAQLSRRTSLRRQAVPFAVAK